MQIIATVTQVNKNVVVVLDKHLKICSHAYAFELIMSLLWPYIFVILHDYLYAASFTAVSVHGKYHLD